MASWKLLLWAFTGFSCRVVSGRYRGIRQSEGKPVSLVEFLWSFSWNINASFCTRLSLENSGCSGKSDENWSSFESKDQDCTIFE